MNVPTGLAMVPTLVDEMKNADLIKFWRDKIATKMKRGLPLGWNEVWRPA
jgi:hypothetical protein